MIFRVCIGSLASGQNYYRVQADTKNEAKSLALNAHRSRGRVIKDYDTIHVVGYYKNKIFRPF